MRENKKLDYQYVRYILAVTGFSLLIGVFHSSTLAHEGATGVVKERMNLMESIGKSMKSLKKMMRQRDQYDAEAVSKAADNIALQTSKILDLFPEGSLDHPTRAKAVIWQKWNEFSALAKQMKTFSGSLSVAAFNSQDPDGHMNEGTHMMGDNSMMAEHKMGSDMEPGPTDEGHLMNDPEALKQMPPHAAYNRLTQVCKDCHTNFRAKKKK